MIRHSGVLIFPIIISTAMNICVKKLYSTFLNSLKDDILAILLIHKGMAIQINC